ncbi:hypothetical protein ACQP1U_17020 [Actinomycetota bacterium]
MNPNEPAPRDQRSWWATDTIRAIAFLSVPAAWAYAGPASGACLFLVAGGVMALRLTDPSPALDALAQVGMLTVAWLAVTGTYQRVSWLDLPAHTIGTVIALHVLDASMRQPPASPRLASRTLELTGLAALLSLLWELGEWAGHQYVSADIHVGYTDTLSDLVAGTLAGPLLATLHQATAPGQRART